MLPETLQRFAKDELGVTASLHTTTLALKLHGIALPILATHFPTGQMNDKYCASLLCTDIYFREKVNIKTPKLMC